jgi:high-affinity Fe2+/Pb2+ permease
MSGSEANKGESDRPESPEQHYDRDYDELLQELRVAQAGVQILFAFLLGIAFQQRFSSISSTQRVIYVSTLMLTAAATVLLIAPVAIHRLLFRRHRKGELVAVSNLLAISGLTALMLAVVGGVWLILLEVASPEVTGLLTGFVAGLFVVTWIVVPLWIRRQRAGRRIPTP